MKRRNLILLMLWSIATILTAQSDLSGDAAGNGTFYLMNVSSGWYLKFGGANNAVAAEGNAGTPVTLTQSGNGYTIKTNAGYLSSDLKMTGAASEWILTQVDGVNQYYLKTSNGSGVLTSKNDANGLLGLSSYNPDNNRQKWVLLTKENLMTMLNVTPVIQAASFDKNDAISAWGISAADIVATDEGSNTANYHLQATGNVSYTQNLGNCTAGTYVLSFDAYCKSTGNATATVSVTKKNSVSINEADTWEQYSMTLNHNNGKEISITISSGNGVELHIDNFVLKYIDGKNKDEEEVEEEEQTDFISKLNDYIDQKQEMVDALNEAGQAAYDISAVIADRDAGNITSQDALAAAMRAIDAAYEAALAAHNQKEFDDLLNSGGGDDGSGDTEEDKEIDVTDLFIKNAGFSTGDDSYWTINGAVISTSGIGVTGATGSYLFKGSSIRQDVEALSNGKYKLTAKVASTNGATVTLTANKGTLTPQSISLQTDTEMTEISLEKVIVYEGKLYIESTSNAEFYLDDFSLSYQEPLPDDPKLQETEALTAEVDFYPTITVTRTITAGTWNTLIVPFDMAIPEGWEVKTLDRTTMEGDNITLYFEDVASIKAGVPHVVHTTEPTSTVTVTNAWLNVGPRSTSTEHIEFIGVYTSTSIPDGSFFINSNKFYLAVGNGNITKGYRGYFTPKAEVNARSLGYRLNSRGEDTEDGTTGIEEPATEEATVVAIYTSGGVRIDTMQQGINILHMSDGTTIKVVIR